ncbi:MAG: SOS response-associated peptidase [Acidimicrobiia bacterium]|nr:SOS response-associated peptidase [Acidimicrobiia bacterium]
MCGRFVSSSPPDEVARTFGALLADERLLEPSWNVAPTNDVWVVTEDGGARRMAPHRWGLVPPWAKDPSVGSRMINARAETLAERNSYKRPFRSRRCIVPVDGFYEWTKVPGQRRKQPWFISATDGSPLALAGLWERWRPKEGHDGDGEAEAGGELRSCTIITGSPNDKVAEVHDRMPVILPPERWDQWLDPQQDDLELLGQFLVPAPSELLTLRPVSTAVNNVRNKGPEVLAALETEDVGESS